MVAQLGRGRARLAGWRDVENEGGAAEASHPVEKVDGLQLVAVLAGQAEAADGRPTLVLQLLARLATRCRGTSTSVPDQRRERLHAQSVAQKLPAADHRGHERQERQVELLGD